MAADGHNRPRLTTLRQNLGSLVTHGLQPFWILEVGSDLVELECVRALLPAEADLDDPDTVAPAVHQVLAAAVAGLSSRQYRSLLTLVLPLEPSPPFPDDYRMPSLQKRRTEAGQKFRGGSQQVTWGTIRSHHEPRALDQLALALVKMEEEYRNNGGQ